MRGQAEAEAIIAQDWLLGFREDAPDARYELLQEPDEAPWLCGSTLLRS